MKKCFLYKKTIFVNLFLCALLLSFADNKIIAQSTEADSLFKAGTIHHTNGMVLLSNRDRKNGLNELVQAANDFRRNIYRLQKKIDSVTVIYSNLQKENPKSPVYYYALGTCIFLKSSITGDTSLVIKAKDSFEKSLLIEPEFVPGHIGFVTIAYRNKDFEEVIRRYKRILEIAPEKYSYYADISSTLAKMGRKDEAREYCIKMINADSTSSSTIQCLLDLANAANVKEEKKLYYDQAIRFSKSDEDLWRSIYYALNYYQTNAPEYTEELAGRILNNKIVLVKRASKMQALDALLFIYKKNKEKLITFAELALKHDNPRILSEIGKYFIDSLKNSELSVKMYQRAYEIITPETALDTYLFTSNPDRMETATKIAKDNKGWIAFKLGKIFYDRKDFKNAEKYLKISLEMSESQRINTPHFLLAAIMIKYTDKEEAAHFFARGIAVNRDGEENIEAMKKLKQLVIELKINKSAETLIRDERIKIVNSEE